ncbi:MAG: hypothetical protein ACLFUF_06940 [Opitutales bacterium]
MGVGDTLTLAGFGRSGYGSYGYTTSAGVTDRRLGQNVVDSFEQADAGSGLLFRYDFDPPDTSGTVGGSLGNDVESIIGPGDSGGSALVKYGDGFALVGVNSFTEGFGGRFNPGEAACGDAPAKRRNSRCASNPCGASCRKKTARGRL